jgi:methionyl-tRNA formyltransferase
MNVVFLSECDPFNVHLIRAVQERWPVATVVRVVTAPGREDRLKKLRRAPVRTLKHFAANRLFYNRLRRRIARQGSYHLFGSATPPKLDHCPVVDVLSRDVNAPPTLELLRSLAPDVLVTSWAPLLAPEIYQTARLAALNVHWGIAPAYRGQDSTFWAMYLGDYPNLGVTIHHLDEGIDTGPVLAHGFPALAPGETEASLLAKNAQVAAELLLEVLDAAGRRPRGRSLAGPGRLFRSYDRSIGHDARFWFRRSVLHPAVPARAGSKQVYF